MATETAGLLRPIDDDQKKTETIVPPAPDVETDQKPDESVRIELSKPAAEDVRKVLTIAEDFRLGQKTGSFVYPENRARFEMQEKAIPAPRVVGEKIGESGILDKEAATPLEKAVEVEAEKSEQKYEEPLTAESFAERIRTDQIEQIHAPKLKMYVDMIDNPDKYNPQAVAAAQGKLDQARAYYEKSRVQTKDDPRAAFEVPTGTFVPTEDMAKNPQLLSKGAEKFLNDLVVLDSVKGTFAEKGYSEDDADELEKLILENVSTGEFWDMFVERANEGVIRGTTIYTPELALNAINAGATAATWAGTNIVAAATPFLKDTAYEEGASFEFLWNLTKPERKAFAEGWRNLLNDSLGIKTASRAWNDYLYGKLKEKVDNNEMSEEQFTRLTSVPDPDNPDGPPIQRDFLSEDDVFRIMTDVTETLSENQQWFLSYLEAATFVGVGVAGKHKVARESWQSMKADIADVRAGKLGAQAQQTIEGLDDLAAYWKLTSDKDLVRLVGAYNEKDLVIGKKNELAAEGVSRLADRIDEIDADVIRISSINNQDKRLLPLLRERESLSLQKTRAKYFDNVPVSIITETAKTTVPLSFIQYKAGEAFADVFEDRLAAEAMGSVGYLTVGKGTIGVIKWSAKKANLSTGDIVNQTYLGIEGMLDLVGYKKLTGKSAMGILSDDDITAYAALLRQNGRKVTAKDIAVLNWVRNLSSAMDPQGREAVADYMQELSDLRKDILGYYEGDSVAQAEVDNLLKMSLATASGLHWMDAAAKIANGQVRMGKIANFEAINQSQGLQELHQNGIQQGQRLVADLKKRMKNITDIDDQRKMQRFIDALDQGYRRSEGSLADNAADLNREARNLKDILMSDTFGVKPLDDHQIDLLSEVELRTSLTLNPELDEVSEANRIHLDNLERIAERSNRLKEMHGDPNNILNVVSTFETLVNEVWKNLKKNSRRGFIKLDEMAAQDGTRINVAPMVRDMMDMAKDPNRPETTSLSKFFGRKSKFWAGSLGRKARQAFNDMAYRSIGDLKPETYNKLVALHSNAKRKDGSANPFYIDTDGAELQPLDIALWYAENKPDQFKGFDALPGEVMDVYAAFREYAYRTKDAGLASLYKDYSDTVKQTVRNDAEAIADQWDEAADIMKREWFDRLRIDGPVNKMQAAQTGVKTNAKLAKDSGADWVELENADTGDYLTSGPEVLGERARTALTKPAEGPQLFTEILSYTYKGQKTPDRILADMADLIESAFTGNVRTQTELQVEFQKFFSEISGRTTSTGMPIFQATDEKQMALVAAASATIEAYLYDQWARSAQAALKRADGAQIGPQAAEDLIDLNQVDNVKNALKFAIEMPDGTQRVFSPINVDRLLLQNNSIMHELARSEESAKALVKARDDIAARVDDLAQASRGRVAIRNLGLDAINSARQIERDGASFIKQFVNVGGDERIRALQEQAVRNLVGSEKYRAGDFDVVIEATGETVDARDVVADGIAHLTMSGLMEIAGFTVAPGKPLVQAVKGEDTLKVVAEPQNLVALFEGMEGERFRNTLVSVFSKRIQHGESVLQPGSNLSKFEVTTVSRQEAEAHVDSIEKIFKFLNISQKTDLTGSTTQLTNVFRSPGANWFLSRGFNLRRGQVSAPYVMGELAVSIATAAGVDMLKLAASNTETADYMLRMMKYPKSMTSQEIDKFSISVIDFVQSEMGRMGMDFMNFIPDGTSEDVQSTYINYVTEGLLPSGEKTFTREEN